MSKITKRLLDAFQPGPKPEMLWDDQLSGFGVRAFPSGQCCFYVDYRPVAGPRRRMSIGRYGPLTCDEARRLAQAILGDVARGQDPALERKTRRTSMTIAELCDRYLADAKKGLVTGKGGQPKRASTLASDEGRIRRHIVPLLGKRLVREIKQSDLRSFLKDVTVGKTACIEKTARKKGKSVVKGGAGTARRTLGLLGGILSYAIDEGVIELNPAHGIRKPAERKLERRLSMAEFKKLGAALSSAKRDGVAWQITIGTRLLALTGCRLGDIAKLRWSELDEASSALRLTSRKTGDSVRPVGKKVFHLLSEVPGARSGFVFKGNVAGGYFTGIGKGVKDIARRAGLTDVTAHTLRHSYSSVAADLNYSTSTVGALVGHKGFTVTDRYIHRLDSLLVAAANEVADYIDGFLTFDDASEAEGSSLPQLGEVSFTALHLAAA